MEVAGDLVTEKELHHAADFLTLTGVPGIASPIVSLFFQKCKRLCHPRIKHTIAAIALLDVAESKINDTITSKRSFCCL